MVEQPATPSRNPNLCASCSSLADGIDDDNGMAALAETKSTGKVPSAALPPNRERTMALGAS
jgi:hypothetical protein